MIYQGSAKYPVKEICIHTTATNVGWMSKNSVEEKIAEIDRWHRARGFNKIGYHYVIDRDGSYGAGRTEEQVGAGVKGHNRGVIHISLVGGAGGSADDSFEDHYTNKQEITLRQLIRDICGRTRIEKISGHNEYANKGCPCFRVKTEEWMYVEKEVPQNFLVALINAILAILGRKK